MTHDFRSLGLGLGLQSADTGKNCCDSRYFRVTHRCQSHDLSSDISVSKINLVSVNVLCVTGSSPFLLYFSFENLFCYSFNCQF